MEKKMEKLMHAKIVGSLRPFTVGSNAGGGCGVVVEHDDGRREKVYRFVTRSIGGRPRDTSEETEDWVLLRSMGLVR